MRGALSCSLVLMLLSCGASHRDAAPTAVVASVDPGPGLDTAHAYSRAIADYIALVAKDSGAAPIPDTLYIGRHADFPPIELPALIAGRSVRIIDPALGESEKHRPRFAYLNVFATFAPDSAEFYMVRFAQGLRHRPDGAEDRHLYYRLNEKQELELDRVSR